MDRRELLKMIAVLTGGVVVGGEVFLSGCTNTDKVSMVFTADDINFLNEVAETILPATSTPGAKAANVGQFMTVIVNDCYEEADQKTFHEGMKKLNEASTKMNSADFLKTDAKQRHDLLVSLDKEAKEYQKSKKDDMPSHYFTLMKQLTLWGYFSSKEGVTQALNYQPVPGRYDGCVDYKKGDKILAGLDG